MNNEEIAERSLEKIDNVSSVCSTIVIKKVEQIMGRNLSTSERDEILEELKTFSKLVVTMHLIDVVTDLKKEEKNESERPSNTLS